MALQLSILPASILDGCLKFGHALLPQRCLLCGANSGATPLCAACRAELPRLAARPCPICALPTPDGRACGACLKRAPHYDACLAAYRYAFPLDKLVQALKYRENLAVATLLAQALSARIRHAQLPDMLLAMPLSPARLRQRGFNQAMEIARQVGRNCGVPVAADICRRVRDTVPQAGLPLKARGKNMRGAFAGTADLTGKSIAVIDDVLTSGATLNELAKTLRSQGAARVSGWIVARTLPR